MQYDAFISYSHAADGRLAPAIQSGLQRFAKPWYRRRALRIFRDQTSLAATPELWPTIVRALESSRYFLLLASPEAAASRWVQREVGWWLEHRTPQTLLIVLTGGEVDWDDAAGDFDWSRTDAVPDGLRGAFAAGPLWVDLRWARAESQLSLKHARFQGAIADLAAPLRGQPKEELQGEEVAQHKRAVRLASGAIVALLLLLLLASGAALLAYEQRGEAQAAQYAAETQSRIAIGRQLAAQAQTETTGPFDLRLLLSLAANRVAPDLADGRASVFSLLESSPQFITFLRSEGTYAGDLAFSPVDHLLAVATQQSVALWDTESLQPRHAPLTPNSTAEIVEFSPDGGTLAVSGADGAFTLWDTKTWKVKRTIQVLPEGFASPMVFSPDGGKIVTAAPDDGSALVFDVASDASPQRIEINGSWTIAAAFSPDGKNLAIGTDAGSVVLVPFPLSPEQGTPNLRRVFLPAPYATQRINALAFSPDGHIVAAGTTSPASSQGGGVVLWEISTEKMVGSAYPATSGDVWVLGFAPDGDHLFVGTWGGALIDLTIGIRSGISDPRTLLNPGGPPVYDLAVNPTDTLLASGGQDTMLWNIGSRVQRDRLRLGSTMAPWNEAMFHPDGEQVIAASGTRLITMAIADFPDGTNQTHQLDGIGEVGSLEVSPDGHTVALLDYDGRLLFWDLDTNQPLGSSQMAHPHPGQTIWSLLTFSPDGTSLITVGNTDETLKLWDVATQQLRATIPVPKAGQIFDMSYSPDGQTVLLAADPGVLAWHPGNAQATLFVPINARSTTAVRFDPSGRYIAVGTLYGAQILDAYTRQVVADRLTVTGTAVNRLVWSPDGQMLALGGTLGYVKLWDTSSWQSIGEVSGLEGWVYPLWFSPDSHLLLAGGVDFKRSIGVWNLDRAVWIKTACQMVGRNLSLEEWRRYVGTLPYQEVCPEWTAPADAPATPMPG